LNINYRTSPVVAGHQGRGFGNLWLSGGPYPGDRAPEASPVRSTKTGATSLFDVLRGTKHTLLLFAGVEPEADTWKHLDTVAEQVRDRYGKHIQVYQVAAGNAPPNGATMNEEPVLDPDLVVHHRFGAPAECLYLIRPDGYVGFRSRPADLDSLQEYLGRIFI
jgi:hypothetical protein